MNWMDLATWATLGMLPLFLVIDLIYRARRWTTPRFWRVRAMAVTIVAFALSFAVPMAWARAIGSWKLFDLSPLGTFGGAVVGILVYELGHYWYHRTVHRNDALWLAFHQMHHSPERVDIWGALYFHPFDSVGWACLGSLALVLGFGVSAEAAIVINVIATFYGMFQHLNVRTPHWLGYFIQRPESHSGHHERGLHGRNYSDLPLWDMVFGTFHNPREFIGECGFYDGGSKKLLPLLLGRKIA